MSDHTDAATSDSVTTRAAIGIRLNVSVPSELLERAKERNPGLSPSAVLQEGLRAMIGCEHDELVCACCGIGVRQTSIVDRVLSRFYGDVQAAIADHSCREGTLEGLSRRIRSLGIEYQLRAARELPAHRLTRAERRSAKVKELPPNSPTTPAPAVATTPTTPKALEAG